MGQGNTDRAMPPLVVEIVEAVADLEGVDEMALPPLAEFVDPDAIEALLEGARPETPGPFLEVRFRYCGYSIVVDGDRSIAIE